MCRNHCRCPNLRCNVANRPGGDEAASHPLHDGEENRAVDEGKNHRGDKAESHLDGRQNHHTGKESHHDGEVENHRDDGVENHTAYENHHVVDEVARHVLGGVEGRPGLNGVASCVDTWAGYHLEGR